MAKFQLTSNNDISRITEDVFKLKFIVSQNNKNFAEKISQLAKKHICNFAGFAMRKFDSNRHIKMFKSCLSPLVTSHSEGPQF